MTSSRTVPGEGAPVTARREGMSHGLEALVASIPVRPSRRMPDLWRIARYWLERDVFWVDLEQPHCFGCFNAPEPDQSVPDAARWNDSVFLERAHLADRAAGGLDGPQNLVPLCHSCHRLMPEFTDGREAIKWVLAGGSTPILSARIGPLCEAYLASQITLTELGAQVGRIAGIKKAHALELVTRCLPKAAGLPRPPRATARAVAAQDMLF